MISSGESKTFSAKYGDKIDLINESGQPRKYKIEFGESGKIIVDAVAETRITIVCGNEDPKITLLDTDHQEGITEVE